MAHGHITPNGMLLYKLVVCGDIGSGKTCITHRMGNEKFTSHHQPTIGIDFSIVNRVIDGQAIRFQIWDTPGQDRSNTIMSTAFRDTHVIIVVYDLTRRESYEHVIGWLEKALAIQTAFDPHVFVIGNKLDLATAQRQVTTQEAIELFRPRGYNFAEVSAKEGDSVDVLVEDMVDKLYHWRMDYFEDVRRKREALVQDWAANPRTSSLPMFTRKLMGITDPAHMDGRENQPNPDSERQRRGGEPVNLADRSGPPFSPRRGPDVTYKGCECWLFKTSRGPLKTH